MVEKIYDLKNKILQHVEKQTMNMDRMDTKEVGELIDMVKDLAEAEESCWEAQYYRKITEGMESSGYGGGTGSSAGYGNQGGMRQGYGTQARQGYGNMQGYGSMGHQDIMEPLRMAIQQASPDEREHLRNEVKTMIGAM